MLWANFSRDVRALCQQKQKQETLIPSFMIRGYIIERTSIFIKHEAIELSSNRKTWLMIFRSLTLMSSLSNTLRSTLVTISDLGSSSPAGWCGLTVRWSPGDPVLLPFKLMLAVFMTNMSSMSSNESKESCSMLLAGRLLRKWLLRIANLQKNRTGVFLRNFYRLSLKKKWECVELGHPMDRESNRWRRIIWELCK